MNAVVKVHKPELDAPDFTRYDSMSDDELFAELGKELGLTVPKLLRCAELWRRLQSRGKDMSCVKSGFALFLPHIAAGSVLAELVVAFSDLPALLKKLARLSPVVQRNIVDGDPVPFVVQPGELRMLPVRALNPAQVRQVFDRCAIRQEPEQIAYLCRPAPVRRTPSVTHGEVVVDVKTQTVRIGRNSAPVAAVVKALAEFGFVEPPKKRK